MSLLWLWILAAPAALLLADNPEARRDLLTRWRPSALRERATRALTGMQAAGTVTAERRRRAKALRARPMPVRRTG